MERRDATIYALIAVFGIGGTAFVSGLVAPTGIATPFLVWGGLFAIFGSGAGLALMIVNAPKHRPLPVAIAVARPDAPPPLPHREFLDATITPEALRDKLVGRTGVQIDAVTKTYVGKWMRVSGVVSDVVGATSDRWMVYLERKPKPSGWSQGISTFFEKPWFDQLSALKIGDRLTVVGKVHFLSGSPSLQDCEIEHLDGPEKSRSKSAPSAPIRRPRRPSAKKRP